MGKQPQIACINSNNERVNSNDKHSSQHQQLIILGATFSPIDEKQIKRHFHFKKVDYYDYTLRGLDVRKLTYKADSAVIILAASDHYIKYLSEATSLKGAIERNPNSYPPAIIVNNGSDGLANLSSCKLYKALEIYSEKMISHSFPKRGCLYLHNHNRAY